MNANQIGDALMKWTIEHSGLENRGYLGMSRIDECPLVLYREMLNGRRDGSWHAHLMCYAGYLWERDIKARLQAVGLYVPGSECELVADWDARFRGHTDGTIEGRLLEIKSTHAEKLMRIRSERRLPHQHFSQVQCYMHHGGFAEAIVVYVARDTGELWVTSSHAQERVGLSLDEKARGVLAAVDAWGTSGAKAPECTCGRCVLK